MQTIARSNESISTYRKKNKNKKRKMISSNIKKDKVRSDNYDIVWNYFFPSSSILSPSYLSVIFVFAIEKRKKLFAFDSTDSTVWYAEIKYT